jgi:hypothetical protein
VITSWNYIRKTSHCSSIGIVDAMLQNSVGLISWLTLGIENGIGLALGHKIRPAPDCVCRYLSVRRYLSDTSLMHDLCWGSLTWITMHGHPSPKLGHRNMPSFGLCFRPPPNPPPPPPPPIHTLTSWLLAHNPTHQRHFVFHMTKLMMLKFGCWMAIGIVQSHKKTIR